MANKTLTARVKFDTKSAEASLNRLSNKINNVQNAINKTSRKGGFDKQIDKAVLAQEKLKQATLKTKLAEEKLTTQKQKTALMAQKVKNATDHSANSAKKLSRAFQSGNASASGLLSTVKRLAATYLGVMGMKAGIATSNTITSTQNRLNSLNGGDSNATQEQMDKMYASANKVRMSYADMMSNASKSVTLAGDAFQGSMDNAIRFQEIMAETYTLGGASAEEMSTSMYQMIQALGAGTLAGDELRSVREGAPLAYKEIERFAQGVYNTTDSLKDMAAEGKISSEMVVAAIMDAGDKIDAKFKETSMTFGQAWDRIKNSAIKAFEPVSNALNKMLNKAAENGAFEVIEQAFWNISKALQIAFRVIEISIQWIADNWSWLQHVIIAGLILMVTYWIYQAGVAVASCIANMIAMGAVAWSIMVAVAAILALVYVFYLWKTGAIDTCQAIVTALLIVAVAVLLVGLIMGSTTVMIIGGVILLLAVIFMLFEEVCYWSAWLAGIVVNIVFVIVNVIIACVYFLLTLIWNIVALIVNCIMAGAMFIGTIIQWIIAFIVNLVVGVANFIGAILRNCVALIINVGTGLTNSISAICQDIGIAFQNAWIWAKNTFWEFIASVLDGISVLEPVINGIASLLGLEGVNFGALSESVRGKKEEYLDYVNVVDAWNSGMNTMDYKDVGEAWSSGWNTMQYADMGEMVSSGWNTMSFASFDDAVDAGLGTLDYVNPNEWASSAGNWGAGVKDSINQWGSQFQNNQSKDPNNQSSWLDNLGKGLGLDFGNLTGFPSVGDGKYDTGGAYKSPRADDMIKNALGDISDDTGSIADSMELSTDDLEYLRKIAEMEWKKEYTTASIKVDMSNYNTVNGDSDLDGIVTKLADKLYEEMNIVANGVYA